MNQRLRSVPREQQPYTSVETDFVTSKQIAGVSIKRSTWSEVVIFGLMLLVIISGAFNRVAGKIMTEPMGNYSFFLSLFNSIMYVILYFMILFARYQMGFATWDMITYPWKRTPLNYGIQRGEDKTSLLRIWDSLPPAKYFVIMGFMDGFGNILGLIATPHISGPMTSLMSQAIVLFSLLCALIILRTKYTYWQVWATLLVIAGATISLIPDIANSEKNKTKTSSLAFCLVMAISTLPNAISFTLKELVFAKRRDLDIFVVNSHSSLFQLLWWPLFLPITLLFKQTGGQSLGVYIKHGFQCFGGFTPNDKFLKQDCSSDPWPYFIYITINLLFNIVLLLLLKRASALLGFMAIKAILPLSVLLFYFNWPLIGKTPISSFVVGGLVVILLGLGLFRYTTLTKNKYPMESKCCSCWLPWCGGGEQYKSKFANLS
eukprot:TRINITY_DN15760_c0_g1_i1.p1 TRINITY_DN15760_c0_g1~~TRINITY_DN15760_c0_g1_i1.p1  ORF type:complete len:432 (+),score=27.30 TRINITY_DN15760_c0_g1_i1:64-1359(+)